MHEEIKYQSIWGKGYILFGVLFGLLFIFCALLLNDFTIFLNVIASIIVIYIGYSMLKQPYAKYSHSEIMVYSFTGAVRKHYQFNDKNETTISGNKLYQNGQKLKLNDWMISKRDWKRMIAFYEGSDGFDGVLVG